MNATITGGCYCGEIRYESTAAPILMVRCHCRDCQRVSGGPYVPAVVFPFRTFKVTKGTIRHYATEGREGRHNFRGFCPKCGSRLTGAESAERGIVAVVASSLDDPTIFVPTVDTFVADAQPWDVPDGATSKFPGPMA